ISSSSSICAPAGSLADARCVLSFILRAISSSSGSDSHPRATRSLSGSFFSSDEVVFPALKIVSALLCLFVFFLSQNIQSSKPIASRTVQPVLSEMCDLLGFLCFLAIQACFRGEYRDVLSIGGDEDECRQCPSCCEGWRGRGGSEGKEENDEENHFRQ